MFSLLKERIGAWAAEGLPDVSDARAQALGKLGDWIAARGRAGNPADLVWVCTHNSRRSHIAQLWALAASVHFDLPHVRSWSGGTEATAFSPWAIAALREDGFRIEDSGERVLPENPVYHASVGPDGPVVRGYSKVFTEPPNPQRDFVAIMVCSSADDACPFVPGADLRVSLPFDDPKASDGTPSAPAAYLAASATIGREVAWVMQLARSGRNHKP